MPSYYVESSTGSGTKYDVDPDIPYCSCPAFKHRPGPCKHVKMVLAHPNRYAQSEGEMGVEPSGEPGLLTIGHSNHSLEGFLELLDEHRITIIVDVRSKPYSRFSPHFGRFKLRDSLREAGIDFFWVGKELGGLETISPTSPAFQQRMASVLRMSAVHRVAIMCSEGDAVKCHRAMKLAAYVHRLPKADQVPITHIARDGSTQDSKELEQSQSKSWLYKCYPGGTKGP